MPNTTQHIDHAARDAQKALIETVQHVSVTMRNHVYSKNAMKWRVEEGGNMIISTFCPINLIYLNPFATPIFLMFNGKENVGQIIDALKHYNKEGVDVENEVIGLIRYLEGLGAIKRIS